MYFHVAYLACLIPFDLLSTFLPVGKGRHIRKSERATDDIEPSKQQSDKCPYEQMEKSVSWEEFHKDFENISNKGKFCISNSFTDVNTLSITYEDH